MVFGGQSAIHPVLQKPNFLIALRCNPKLPDFSMSTYMTRIKAFSTL
jgi:hypothetical protein